MTDENKVDTPPDVDPETAKRNLKSRNAAVALAVVAFVLVMYSLTMVKYRDLLMVDKY